MRLIYLNRHANCPHYIGDNPVGFGVIEANGGSTNAFDHAFSVIAFLLKGELRVSGAGFQPFSVYENQMFVIPSHTDHHIEILRDCMGVRLYIIGNNLDFCSRIVSEEMMRKQAQGPCDLHALPMVPVLTTFVKQMETYTRDQLLCCDIHTLKQRELSALLQAYYRPSVLRGFLAMLYRNHESFLDKVMALAHSYLNIEQMAERLNMSRSTFIRNFTDQFRESPSWWLTTVRTRDLFHELRDTDSSFEAVAQKLRFSSQQSMTTFCRKNIGATPTQVRAGEVDVPRKLSSVRPTLRGHQSASPRQSAR